MTGACSGSSVISKSPHVVETVLLRPEVGLVAEVGRRWQWQDLVHRDPGLDQPAGLGRVVGEETDRAHTELAQHAGRIGVVTGIDGQAELGVGVHGVGPAVLGDVGPQLVDQANPSALMPGGVNEDTGAVGRDETQCQPELYPTVTAERTKGVAGQTLRVEADQDILSILYLAQDQGDIDSPGAIEGSGFEHAVRGGQRDTYDFGGKHGPVYPNR